MAEPSETQKHVLRLLRDALDVDPAERVAFVRSRCADDPVLESRVLAMLAGAAAEEAAIGAAADDPAAGSDGLVGTRLGPFRLVERIGKGGMGVVYRALREDADFIQEVAIKRVRRGFDFDDIEARFLRERRILAALDHPNLARFIDGGIDVDGRPWFALEFVRGASVTRWCDVQRLDLRERVGVFLEICAAVQHAHVQLVVHRDLKPANVLVDADGHVKLLDFGIAKLLDDDGDARATTVGFRHALTPEYAAPEQFGSGNIGVATDVYSLGVILYELLAGTLPYEVDRADLRGAERTVRDAAPLALTQGLTRGGADEIDARLRARAGSARTLRRQLRGDLARIVYTALEKEPVRRYATVQALSDDLVRWLEGLPVRVAGNRFGYRVGKFFSRHRLAVAFGALAISSLLATTAIALRSAHNERILREKASAEVDRAGALRAYLTLMFRSATQRNTQEALTADAILRQGAERIFTHFKDQPEAGQTSALMLSQLYAALGDPEGAAPLLERLLAWPGIEDNPDVLAAARSNMAAVELHRGREPHARELLAAAQAHWNTRPERWRQELASSRTLQARLERARGDTAASIATLDRAITEMRALQRGADAEVAYALVSLSITLAQVGRVDEALARARESVDEYTRLGDTDSVEALTALGNRAAIATMLGQNEVALADLRTTSTKLTVYGPSEALAKANTQLGELLAKMGRFDEALPLLRESLAMAVRFGGEDGRLAAGARQRLAQALLDGDRFGEAGPLVEHILEHAQGGERGRDKAIALRMRAQLRFGLDDIGNALHDLDAAERLFEDMGSAGERQLARTRELRTRVLARRSAADA